MPQNLDALPELVIPYDSDPAAGLNASRRHERKRQ